MLQEAHLSAGGKQRRAVLEDAVDVEHVKGEEAVRARHSRLRAYTGKAPPSELPTSATCGQQHGT